MITKITKTPLFLITHKNKVSFETAKGLLLFVYVTTTICFCKIKKINKVRALPSVTSLQTRKLNILNLSEYLPHRHLKYMYSVMGVFI